MTDVNPNGAQQHDASAINSSRTEASSTVTSPAPAASSTASGSKLATAPAAKRQLTVRELNLSLVAHAIFDAAQPPSRADVAAVTGLARATVSSLVDSLLTAHIVTEMPPTSGGAGRPAIPLMAGQRSLVGLGLEVSVDYLAVTAVDLRGEQVAQVIQEAQLADSQPLPVLRDLGLLARQVVDSVTQRGMRVVGGRLAVPGLVDQHTGILEVAPNLGWTSVDPVAGLELPDIDIQVANEAKLAALAEYAASGTQSFLYISPEIGIGGAIVVDGTLFGGERGWNGEVGHVVVDPTGPQCRCGARGCLEQYLGRDVVLAAGGMPAGASVEDMAQAAASGDRQVLAALDGAGRALGCALADFINLVGVHTVIIGGQFAALVPWMLRRMRQELTTRVLAAPYSGVEVGASVVGPQAALVGGAREVLRHVVDNPAAYL